MSFFDTINPFRRRRLAELERRVEFLESHLLKVSQTLKTVTELALRMGTDLEAIARHAQAQSSAPQKGKAPPRDDFYN